MKLDAWAQTVFSILFGAFAGMVGIGLGIWKSTQWWKGRRRLNTNRKILQDIEMEFAEEDDDELLYATTTHVDNDWADLRIDDASNGAALQSNASLKKPTVPVRKAPRSDEDEWSGTI
ncbi:hypothetical protein T492DRAFT_982059 [Pavlovales sp. CCMP2436]|nr:hypothetical protein T492DRAFT_982059 [Pavlovales sp. CCMP2436]|mmetsp:Transcript_2428/g.5935  ORF Transcript_2428/g.5935 Transcript_2428/m.5935 type:complete len:118 (-) Transcript_2428:23-376(-)